MVKSILDNHDFEKCGDYVIALRNNERLTVTHFREKIYICFQKENEKVDDHRAEKICFSFLEWNELVKGMTFIDRMLGI